MFYKKRTVYMAVCALFLLLLIPGNQAEAARKKKQSNLTFAQNYGTVKLKKGSSKTLSIRCNKKKIRGSRLKWKSNRNSVVRVSNGKIKAMKAGTAYVYAKLKGKKSNTLRCKIHVYQDISPIRFKGKNGTIVLNKGESQVLVPERKGYYTTFTSSNRKIVDVSSGGRIKAVSYGTAQIACDTYGKYRYRAVITVKVGTKVTGISVEQEATPNLGEKFRLEVKALPSNASIKTMAYQSSDPEIVRVNSDGTLYAASEGMSVVTVRSTDGTQVQEQVHVYVSEDDERENNGITKWVAHRGLSSEAPENTMSAFRLAGEAGFDSIECDVRETKDGQIVISHDASLNRMFGVDKEIKDLTLSELKQYPVTGGNNIEKYPDNRIPTLQEFIECCNKYGCIPMIEVKADFSEKGLGRLYNELSESNNRPIVISFYDDVLMYMRKRNDKMPLQKVMKKLTEAELKKCAKYDWEVDVHYKDVTNSMVKRVHSAGCELNVWTVNKKNIARLFYKWGTDYISSDYKFF